MTPADNLAARAGQLSASLVVIGGGVAGLWTALKGARAGQDVLLIEKDRIGAGASGGFLGALMPFMPENRDAKKDFQFRALGLLEDEACALCAQTGISTGYGHVGRLMPIADERQERAAKMRVLAARENWDARGGFKRHSFDVCAENPFPEWFAPQESSRGMIFETLTARISPMGLLAALTASLNVFPKARIVTGEATPEIDPRAGTVRLSGGATVRFEHLVLANGVGTSTLIAPLLARAPGALGSAVKGQAALLDAGLTPERAARLPIIFDDGVYIIAHEDGRVAVGSTSEAQFTDPASTDDKLDTIIERARAICPPLVDAPVLDRWAGLRPRAPRRDPMIGVLPGLPDIHVLTGGFKTTFGLAHLLADAVLGGMGICEQVIVPEGFSVQAHLGWADEGERRRRAGM